MVLESPYMLSAVTKYTPLTQQYALCSHEIYTPDSAICSLRSQNIHPQLSNMLPAVTKYTPLTQQYAPCGHEIYTPDSAICSLWLKYTPLTQQYTPCGRRCAVYMPYMTACGAFDLPTHYSIYTMIDHITFTCEPFGVLQAGISC